MCFFTLFGLEAAWGMFFSQQITGKQEGRKNHVMLLEAWAVIATLLLLWTFHWSQQITGPSPTPKKWESIFCPLLFRIMTLNSKHISLLLIKYWVCHRILNYIKNLISFNYFLLHMRKQTQRNESERTLTSYMAKGWMYNPIKGEGRIRINNSIWSEWMNAKVN